MRVILSGVEGLRRHGLTIAWAALLFGLSSIPDLSFPVSVFSWDDKIQHVLAYMPLGFLLLRSIVWQDQINRKKLWLAIVIGALYGATDEIHQHFVPGRFMDWTDAAADAAGVMLGGCFFYLWRRRQLMTQRQAKSEKMIAS
jgi:VanZ family protein